MKLALFSTVLLVAALLISVSQVSANNSEDPTLQPHADDVANALLQLNTALRTNDEQQRSSLAHGHCLKVKAGAGWTDLNHNQIHAAIKTAAANVWANSAHVNHASPKVKMNIGRITDNNAGTATLQREGIANAGALPKQIANIYAPTTYRQLLNIASQREAYRVGANIDDAWGSYIKYGPFLFRLDGTSQPPFYVRFVGCAQGDAACNTYAKSPRKLRPIADAYNTMFAAAGNNIAHADVIAAVTGAKVGAGHAAAWLHPAKAMSVYAQSIAEARRNHLSAITNVMLYQLLNAGTYTTQQIFGGLKPNAGGKHPMARAGTLAEVGVGLPGANGKVNNAFAVNPSTVGGRAGTDCRRLEINAVVDWLIGPCANAANYGTRACVNPAPAANAVNAAKAALVTELQNAAMNF